MSNRRITPSLVISVLALVVATTGTGIAATKINGRDIAPHTITSLQLAKGAVAGINIKPKAITSAQVKPRSLTALALADGVIVNNTVIAPAGPKGDTGTAGTPATVAFDPAKIITVEGNNSGSLSPSESYTSIALCPAGSYVTGGGYSDLGGNGTTSGAMLIPSVNQGSVSGWQVTVKNYGGSISNTAWHAFVLCAAS